MSVLSLAVVMQLATDPACGAATPGSEFAERLRAIAIHESAGDPLLIGVNADLVHGLPAAVVHSATTQEAASKARNLIARGRSIDLGLMQINSANLVRHGLTVETAFDRCRNMRAGADHYADDVRAVWSLAARRYNTGSTERGAAYAASVEVVLSRVRTVEAGPASVASEQPPDPSEPPAWDLWAHQEWLERKTQTPPPEPSTPALSITEATPQENTP